MNKSDIVAKIATDVGLTNAQASAAFGVVLDSIQDCLKNGEAVTFSGFGKFYVATSSERMGVNPKTGEKIKILASKKVKFKASPTLNGTL